MQWPQMPRISTGRSERSDREFRPGSLGAGLRSRERSGLRGRNRRPFRVRRLIVDNCCLRLCFHLWLNPWLSESGCLRRRRRINRHAGVSHHPLDIETLIAYALIKVEECESDAVDGLGERLHGEVGGPGHEKKDHSQSLRVLRTLQSGNQSQDDERGNGEAESQYIPQHGSHEIKEDDAGLCAVAERVGAFESFPGGQLLYDRDGEGQAEAKKHPETEGGQSSEKQNRDPVDKQAEVAETGTATPGNQRVNAQRAENKTHHRHNRHDEHHEHVKPDIAPSALPSAFVRLADGDLLAKEGTPGGGGHGGSAEGGRSEGDGHHQQNHQANEYQGDNGACASVDPVIGTKPGDEREEGGGKYKHSSSRNHTNAEEDEEPRAINLSRAVEHLGQGHRMQMRLFTHAWTQAPAKQPYP